MDYDEFIEWESNPFRKSILEEWCARIGRAVLCKNLDDAKAMVRATRPVLKLAEKCMLDRDPSKIFADGDCRKSHEEYYEERNNEEGNGRADYSAKQRQMRYDDERPVSLYPRKHFATKSVYSQDVQSVCRAFVQRDYERCIDMALELISAEQNGPKDSRRLAVLWAKVAGSYGFTRRLTLAVEAYTKAIEQEPSYAEYYCWRAMAYQKLKSYHKAIEDVEYTLRLNPDHAVAKMMLVQLNNDLRRSRGGYYYK